ncbi:hypothetical protein ACJIZ3_022381 [Penstemon smallii]|uniref:DCD domain-containing protein n=1 Tax=Penstemon smallii TaxID=265156 RepID=A0ABD3TN64_9LAMI
MGSVRKNKTLPPWTPIVSARSRNLKKNELGAVIFGCKHHTITECLLKQMFGLPVSHFSYVKNIAPGLTLFLFNYSDRTLHGIFEAATPGKMNINPYAWITSEGTENTPYAAQVRVHVRKQCRQLHEEEFKPIIADNYYEDKHFWFELDKKQTGRLTNLFLSSPLPEKVPRPSNAASWNRMFDVSPRSESYEAIDQCTGMIEMGLKENLERSNVLVHNDRSISAPVKKWSDLFITSDRSGMERGHASSFQEAVKPLPEACSDAVNTDSDSAVPYNWEELADSDMDDTYENEGTCMQDLERDNDDPNLTDVPSSEDGTFWDSVIVAKEAGKTLDSSKEKSIYGDVLRPSKYCDRDDDLPKLTNGVLMENGSPTFGEVLTDIQSSRFQFVVMKLLQEIEGLKASQLKQSVKIDSLEHELAHTKVEIDHLKKWSKLESIPFSSGDHCDEENCESPFLKTEEYVLIVGGFDGSAWLPSLDSYSPSEDNVTSLCPMTFVRSYASVAKLNGELYLLGGVYDGVWYDTVESYNPTSNQWVQRTPLNHEKGSLAGASLNDKIYAIGGGDGVDCFSEVELFDINQGRWISTQSMLEKRFAPAATDMNGALYVAGGYDGKDYLRSVERFDPREPAWTSLSSMNTNRGCHSVVAFKEKIYALGGYNGSTMVPTVEVFDPRVGLWMKEEPMSVSRGYFGSFVFEGKIYAIGGVNGNETFDVIECYEEGSGWHTVGGSAMGKRCYFSALTF